MGFALKKPDDAVGSAAPAIMIGLFVAFGGVLFGCVSTRVYPLALNHCSNIHLDMIPVSSVVSLP